MKINSYLIAKNGTKDTISYLMVDGSYDYLYMGCPNPDPENRIASPKVPAETIMKRGLLFPLGVWADRPLNEDELKLKGIEFQGVWCSLTWKDQFGLASIEKYVRMGMPINYEFANGNKLLLTNANIDAFEATWLPARLAFFPLPQ